MPGANARALEKAKSLAADALILDLEDSVAPEAKGSARAQVVAAVKAGGFAPREVAVRVNALDSAWGLDDLAAVAAAGPDAILVPKVSAPEDLIVVGRFLTELGVSASPADYGFRDGEWRELIDAALDGERGQNFISSRERVMRSLCN